MQLINYLFAVCFLLFLPVFITAQQTNFPTVQTPTQHYLQTHHFDEIQDHIDERFIPFYFSIIEHEKEEGFFGYHGSTQKYRIFQDILRAVCEEVFGYAIPEDYQFLRVPGDDYFDLPKNKISFYEKFDRKQCPESIKNEIVNYFFLEPFNRYFQTHSTLMDLTYKDKQDCWEVVEEFLETLDTLSRGDYYDYVLEAEPSIKKSSVQKKSIRKLLLDLMKYVDEQENISSKPFLKKYNPNKAGQKLSGVFQKVLSAHNQPVNQFKFNQWLSESLSFRKFLDHTFYFLYHDYDAVHMERFFFPYNDTYKEQQKFVLAMNIPLFGNYFRSDESTTRIFSNDSSIENGDGPLISILKNFFDEAGIDSSIVKQLKNIAVEELKAARIETGCILQFFDPSHLIGKPDFQILDENVFVSYDYGIPVKDILPAEVVLGSHAIEHNQIDLQFRLIASNKSTLNPYSGLRIVRHDLVDPQTSVRIIERMKDALRNASVDQEKLILYKAKLDAAWGNSY